MPLLVIIAGFRAAAAALSGSLRSQNPRRPEVPQRAEGLLSRCLENPRHLLTVADLGAVILALLGFLIVTHSHRR